MAEPIWAASHQKEADRQVQQRCVRLLECADAGSLLHHESAIGMDDLVANYRLKQAENRVRRDRDRARKDADLKDHVPLDFPALLFHATSAEPCLRLGMRRAAEACTADVYVVANPAKPQMCKLWAAVLRGGALVDESYVMGSGAAGICIAYISAMSMRKVMWVSPAFLAAHPVLVNVLVKNAGVVRPQRWRFLNSADGWVAHVRDQPKNAAQHVALVMPGEMAVLRDAATAVGRKQICTIGGSSVFVVALARLD